MYKLSPTLCQGLRTAKCEAYVRAETHYNRSLLLSPSALSLKTQTLSTTVTIINYCLFTSLSVNYVSFFVVVIYSFRYK